MRNFIIKRFKIISWSTTGFLVVFLLWSVLARDYNTLILPSPWETWQSFLELYSSGVLIENLVITVKRTLMGFLLAVIWGVLLAVLLNKSSKLNLCLRPLITVIQTTPPVIWLALAVIWFGIAEDITPIFLIFIVTFPIIFININEGLQNVDQKLIDMAQLYSANRKQIYFEIYLPALIPYFVSSLSVGLAFAWKSSVFAEFIGSASGVGFALSMANSNLETPKLYAWALVLVVLMLFFEYLIFRPWQRRLIGWHQYEKNS
jgi:NitT/TauT family transport system permease protein